MLLQHLNTYAAEQMTPRPRLYARSAVRFIIELDAQGRLLSPRPTDTADSQTPAAKFGERRFVPTISRSNDTKPRLLCDNAEYVFGVGANAKRSTARHTAFIGLAEECGRGTGHPDVLAILHFLQSDPLAQLDPHVEFSEKTVCAFRVAGRFVTDQPVVQAFWADYNALQSATSPIMQCLVCGQQELILERAQMNVTGVPGTGNGVALVSANHDAFDSYGLVAGYNAPMCAECSEGASQALSELIDDKHTIRWSATSSIVVIWTDKPQPFSASAMLTHPSPADVAAMYASVWSGGVSATDSDGCYVLSLSGSKGRIAIRSWLDTTLRDVKLALARWFSWQRIARRDGQGYDTYGVMQLAESAFHSAKQLPLSLLDDLITSALTNRPLPISLLQQILNRCRAERGLSPERAALIKAVLVSQAHHPEEYLVQLDEQEASIGYICGRLFWLLAQIQARAGQPQATIVDRYLGSASSTPATVFGMLLRGAGHHLSKVKRSDPVVAAIFRRQLASMCERISAFPAMLSARDQGMFHLGFFHQEMHDQARRAEARTRRQQEQGVNDHDSE